MAKKNKKEATVSALKYSALWGVLLFWKLLVVDMVTKVMADAYFSQADAPQKIDIIKGWLALTITYNDGIAYGIGGGSPTWVKILVIALTGVIMLTLAILYFKIDKRRSWMKTGFVFVVSGGVGNLIDRVYYRVWENDCLYGVRDMVDLSRFGFAVCNFADFFICAGAVIIVLALLFFDKDAIFPSGRYKALAEEYEQKENAKKAKKDE
jgi:signal peptidase II